MKIVPEIALPSSGLGSPFPPTNSSWPLRYTPARVLRITMAKTEMTTLRKETQKNVSKTNEREFELVLLSSLRSLVSERSRQEKDVP